MCARPSHCETERDLCSTPFGGSLGGAAACGMGGDAAVRRERGVCVLSGRERRLGCGHVECLVLDHPAFCRKKPPLFRSTAMKKTSHRRKNIQEAPSVHEFVR